MSATGARVLPAKAFETSLAELKRWRDATAETLAAFRRWAVIGRLIDEQAAARLAHLERRLASERLTIAFAGEHSRGKSELINALFFADVGARLLPGGARCPTEILWDPARPASIRLLPIETRASGKTLRECLGEIDTWVEVPLDPSRPEALAGACEALSESIEVDHADAARLGVAAEAPGRAVVARWRYAVINFPHPLLAGGFTILDTADQRTLAAEPELTFQRVPDAAAIVFTLSAEIGITHGDLQLWVDHIAPIGGIEQTCFVVLNKIDELRDASKAEGEVLAEIDRQVKAAAEALGAAPTRIFALSAKQAFAAKIAGDRDAVLKSRLYRLEQSLSRGMVSRRRLDHATAIRAEAHGVFAETRSLIASRLGFTNDQLDELAALQGKNQKLVEVLAKKAGVERGRLEQARAMLPGVRTVHNRHADELARLLDPEAVRTAAIHAREAVASSAFSKGIGEALDAFFQESREKIRRAVEVIDEARNLMATVSRKFTDEYKIAAVDAAPFATGRFLAELDRLEEHTRRDFKGRSSLIMRGRKTLGTQFFDTVALQVIHVFEIADRETRAWMGGFIRPLDAQISAYQEQSNTRIEGMGRIQNAEVDLVARLGELKSLAAEVAAQREQWEAHHRRLMALLEVEREPSLA
jgi:HAMP domain-containing protein